MTAPAPVVAAEAVIGGGVGVDRVHAIAGAGLERAPRSVGAGLRIASELFLGIRRPVPTFGKTCQRERM
mgnify:CR=1 FL=1